MKKIVIHYKRKDKKLSFEQDFACDDYSIRIIIFYYD